MKIRLALAALGALALVAAPTGTAEPPDVAGNPALLLQQGAQQVFIPPAEPKVGDTLVSTWATFYCHPSCDPSSPEADPTVGRRVIHPSDAEGPAGYAMAWERCPDATATNCAVVRSRTRQEVPGADRYVTTDADSGAYIRSAVYATNLDCSEVVREGPDAGRQDCRWERRGVYSALAYIKPTILVQPATLPEGQAGVPYTAPISFANGSGYAFTPAGTLPPGLRFTGHSIEGTPTAAGTYTYTLAVAGAGAAPGSRTWTLRIRLGFAQTPFATATTGVPYTAPLSVVGANGAVTWNVASGTLPPGLTIANGALTGTPTQKGTFSFTLQATDAAGNTATTTPYSVNVVWPVLHGVPTKLTKATLGLRYRATLTIAGGTAPYTFAITAGRLPRGLTLSTTGAVVGKATEKTRKTSFRFVVLVTDRYGAETPILFVLPYKGTKR